MLKVSEPFQKHEVAEYEKKRYRGWDQRIVHIREQRILKRFLRKITRDSGDFLDVPCGYGRFSSLVWERGLRLVSSDISFHMVKRACERNSREISSEAVRGVVADAKQGLPFRDNAFAGILSMRFFHHIHSGEDREKILSEFARITDGWIILSFYQTNFLHILQRRFRRLVKKGRTKIKMIPRKVFEQELLRCNLKLVRISPLLKGLHAQHIALIHKPAQR